MAVGRHAGWDMSKGYIFKLQSHNEEKLREGARNVFQQSR